MDAKINALKQFFDSIPKNISAMQERVRKLAITDKNIPALDERLTSIRRLEDQCDAKKMDLYEIATTEQVATFSEIFSTIDDNFDSVKCEIRMKLSSIEKSIVKIEPGNHSSGQTHSSFNLPEIPLPKFSGKFIHWVDFKGQFMAIFNKNNSLDEFAKLHYLRQAIEGGDAEKMVSTDDTFSSLWLAIQNKYEKRGLLIDSHISNLFEFPKISPNSSEDLEALINNVQKQLRDLKSLNLPMEPLSQALLIHLVSTKLDFETIRLFKTQQKGNDPPTWDNFVEFLENRAIVLAHLKPTWKKPQKEEKPKQKQNRPVKTERTLIAQGNPSSSSSQSSNQTSRAKCYNCSGPHYFTKCHKFLNLPIPEKLKKLGEFNVCIRCFSYSHKTEECDKGHCNFCTEKHHPSLHDNTKQPSSNSSATAIPEDSKAFVATQKQVLLNTAVLQVQDMNGNWHRCRALLDSGAMSNFISSNLSRLLKLRRNPTNMVISGISDSKSKPHGKVCSTIKSTTSDFTAQLEFLILDTITTNLPNYKFDSSKWQIPQHLILADPTFNIPGKIDMLIGMDVYNQLFTGHRIQLADDLPLLQETVFGWTLSGILTSTNLHTTSEFSGAVSNEELSEQLREFFDSEKCSNTSELSLEEQEVEEHFLKTHRRDSSGRYIVELPLRENFNNLGNSEAMAIRRFNFLEKKLGKLPEIKAQYSEFMTEYLTLNHMKPLQDPSNASDGLNPYFLPHHAVLRPESSTTKLRVVFDGSASTTSGLSLNNILKVGPTVQPKLLDILLRFRTHRIAITGDIAKMYRQILVAEKHRKLQQIKWRNEPSESLTTFQLSTVTYGTSSAPYLATRTLRQLCDDEGRDFEFAVRAIREETYVDDVLSGADSIEEAIELKTQLVEMLKRGGFDLHKWCSNSSAVLSQIPEEFQEQKVVIQKDGATKTLGITWIPSEDSFSFNFKFDPPKHPITKRQIASDVAKVFDPLGLVGPVVLPLKMQLQQLWKIKKDWDDELSDQETSTWLQLRAELPKINNLKVNRCILDADSSAALQLHGFCDASLIGYGACVYVRTDNGTEVKTTLLISKSSVAPLTQRTIPQLELCSAVMLSQLVSYIITTLNHINFESVNLWSDSTIALSWIHSHPGTFKVFVANRIAKIQSLTESCLWRHVGTTDNPADIISRGLMPEELKNCGLWWNGSFSSINKFTMGGIEIHTHQGVIARPEIIINFRNHQFHPVENFRWFQFSLKTSRMHGVHSAIHQFRENEICLLRTDQIA